MNLLLYFWCTLAAAALTKTTAHAGHDASLPFSTLCGLPDTIVVTRIPSSFNTIFTTSTTRGGIGLMGISAMGKLVNASFVGAQIAVVNEFWSLTCVYESEGTSIGLASNASPEWEACIFSPFLPADADAIAHAMEGRSRLDRTCKPSSGESGGVHDCVVLCLTQPPPFGGPTISDALITHLVRPKHGQ